MPFVEVALLRATGEEVSYDGYTRVQVPVAAGDISGDGVYFGRVEFPKVIGGKDRPTHYAVVLPDGRRVVGEIVTRVDLYPGVTPRIERFAHEKSERSATMMENRIVEAVGVSANSLNVPGKLTALAVQAAMEAAIRQAAEDGITDAVEIRARMMAAREGVKRTDAGGRER